VGGLVLKDVVVNSVLNKMERVKSVYGGDIHCTNMKDYH